MDVMKVSREFSELVHNDSNYSSLVLFLCGFGFEC